MSESSQKYYSNKTTDILYIIQLLSLNKHKLRRF